MVATAREYQQRAPASGGSHSEGSRSDFSRLGSFSVGMRLSGSLAKSARSASSQAQAPMSHAALRGKTWSSSMGPESRGSPE